MVANVPTATQPLNAHKETPRLMGDQCRGVSRCQTGGSSLFVVVSGRLLSLLCIHQHFDRCHEARLTIFFG